MARLSAGVVLLVVLLAGAARDAAAQQDGELRVDRLSTMRVSSRRSTRRSGPVPLPPGASSVDAEAATPDATPDGPPPVDVIPTCA